MAGIAVTKKAKARKAEWERVCNLSPDQLKQEYFVKAAEAWGKAWELVHMEKGWKTETKVKDGQSNGNGIVYSTTIPDDGKVFRLEAEVPADPNTFFNIMVKQADVSPSWNPTILVSKVVSELSSNTDLAYYVTAEAARGVVDSRDFINLRHWKTREDTILSAGCSIMYPDLPPVKKYIRGENRPGCGMAFKAVPGQPNRCRFIWIINTDLKGLLPGKLVEEAIPDVCIETLENAVKLLTSGQHNGTKE